MAHHKKYAGCMVQLANHSLNLFGVNSFRGY